ncbi:MAG: hypothetical protein JXA22_06145 [Candidatus Thermoplasmatota archaeon]|nr:hypothetical protein [Candidatus Thermoplasmatota archaeon]
MRLVWLRLLSMIMVVMVAGAFGLIRNSDDAKAVGEAIVTVNPASGQSSLHVKVDPSRGGIVTFSGYIAMTEAFSPDSQFIIVNLHADVEGWEVTTIPVLTLTASYTQLSFTVSVRVPSGYKTSGMDATKVMTITGTWEYQPESRSGNVQPLEVFVFIDQYYEYSIKCDRSFVQTSPGGEFDIDLEISNDGNGDDKISINIDRRDRLERNGWAFVLDTTKFVLPYQQTIKVPVHVVTPREWDGWRNDIIVIQFDLTSEQAFNSNSVAEPASYSIFVLQRGVSVPGFEPFLFLLAVLISSLFAFSGRRR